MTNEELNTAVYQKMFSEQEKFREWLMGQPPGEILHHCYEYIVREDIVLAMEYHNLSDKQCNALLKSSTPLADVYREFDKHEFGYMDHVWDMVECRANAVIRADFQKAHREESR